MKEIIIGDSRAREKDIIAAPFLVVLSYRSDGIGSFGVGKTILFEKRRHQGVVNGVIKDSNEDASWIET